MSLTIDDTPPVGLTVTQAREWRRQRVQEALSEPEAAFADAIRRVVAADDGLAFRALIDGHTQDEIMAVWGALEAPVRAGYKRLQDGTDGW